MKNNWWKILSVLLILYTLVCGLLVPIKAGITAVTPMNIKCGEKVKLHISGYNSAFRLSGSNDVWLKLNDTFAIKGYDAVIEDDKNMDVQFDIPNGLPIKVKDKKTYATLVVNNDVDGAFPYPDAVIIKQDTSMVGMEAAWSKTPQNLSKAANLSFPFRNILMETIKNTFYHVPMWFAMMFMFLIAAIYSGQALKTKDIQYDHKANAYTEAGVVFGLLGLVTGALWAKHTWGQYWSFDVKQNMSAVCILIYSAYFVLRSSFEDQEVRSRISAVYNIFSFAAMIPLLWVIPRLVSSLHPGNGGNPAFGSQDLDNTMRMIFYPANIGWILFGCWLAQLRFRMAKVEETIIDNY